ncbi:MAG: hypothetical protein KIT81_10700 [Alphaproteobacteria bacterium]|nr:hypothetical protein [Alphaproteobacteria bacterium]
MSGPTGIDILAADDRYGARLATCRTRARARTGAMSGDLDRIASRLAGDFAGRRYAAIPPAWRDEGRRRAAEDDVAARQWFHSLLAAFIASHEHYLSRFHAVPLLLASYAVEFERILDWMDAEEGQVRGESFGFDDDVFLKDLGLVSGRLIPCLTRVGDPYGGLPRRAMLGSAQGILRMLPYALLSGGGFWPYLEIHVHKPMWDRLRGRVDGEVWRKAYRLMAAAIEALPDLRGITAASWLWDGALSEVSPHLHIHRQIAEAHGARFLDLGCDEETRISALARSERRRELCRQGRYQPRRVLMVWSRRDLLRWARDSCLPHVAIETRPER